METIIKELQARFINITETLKENKELTNEQIECLLIKTLIEEELNERQS